MEIWRDVIGYEGIYQVSNMGNVKVLDRYVHYKTYRKGKTIKERLLNPSGLKGYKRVTLRVDNVRKNFLVHRLVAMAFISNPDNKTEVNHINGVKDDNRVVNLEWSTRSENVKHAYTL